MLTELTPSVTSRLPGVIPRELLGPGPSNNTVFSFLEFANTTNSVPLAPIAPVGILSSKVSGSFLLIFPVIILIVPD